MAGSWEGTGTPDAAVHSFIRTKMTLCMQKYIVILVCARTCQYAGDVLVCGPR